MLQSLVMVTRGFAVFNTQENKTTPHISTTLFGFQSKEEPKRVIWHPQGVKILTEIVTNMKTANEIQMTNLLSKPSGKNIHLRNE